MARNKLLRRLGYEVRAVPFFDWDKLEPGTAQEEYLRALLGLPG